MPKKFTPPRPIDSNTSTSKTKNTTVQQKTAFQKNEQTLADKNHNQIQSSEDLSLENKTFPTEVEYTEFLIKIKEKEIEDKRRCLKEAGGQERKAKVVKENEKILKLIEKYKSISRDIVEELVLQLSKNTKASKRTITETLLQDLHVTPKDIALELSESESEESDDDEVSSDDN